MELMDAIYIAIGFIGGGLLIFVLQAIRFTSYRNYRNRRDYRETPARRCGSKTYRCPLDRQHDAHYWAFGQPECPGVNPQEDD